MFKVGDRVQIRPEVYDAHKPVVHYGEGSLLSEAEGALGTIIEIREHLLDDDHNHIRVQWDRMDLLDFWCGEDWLTPISQYYLRLKGGCLHHA
jgi:hypothetical protein